MDKMDNKNMELWEQFRSVPDEAKKKITAGNLRGKSDINPVWRIKKLTEMFGPVGFGWYTETIKEWTEPAANGEIAYFIRINLYYKYNGEWSKPIEGEGGNMLVNNFPNAGMKTNDEALKMAKTDAISVACKSLGIAADVYFEQDTSKYTNSKNFDTADKKHPSPGTYQSIDRKGEKVTIEDTDKIVTEKQLKRLFAISKKTLLSDDDIKKDIKERYNYDTRKQFKKSKYDEYCDYLESLVDDKLFEELSSLLVEKNKKNSDLNGFLEKWGLDSISRLSKKQVSSIMTRLNKVEVKKEK
jgi:hypothetical protein